MYSSALSRVYSLHEVDNYVYSLHEVCTLPRYQRYNDNNPEQIHHIILYFLLLERKTKNEIYVYYSEIGYTLLKECFFYYSSGFKLNTFFCNSY